MHLTLSGSRWQFQKRVPLDLTAILGTTPLRLALTASRAREARRQAIRLAAVADTLFDRLRRREALVSNGSLPLSLDEGDPREAMIRVLRACLDDAEGTIAAQQVAIEHTRQLTELRVLTECHTQARQEHEAVHRILGRFHDLYPRLMQALSDLRRYREREGATGDVLQSLQDLRAEMTAMRGGVETVIQRSEPKVLPLLSEGLQSYLAIKGPELQAKDGDGSRYVAYTIPNAVKTFVAFAGDKPANHYLPSELDGFITALGRLPANWSKLAMFKALSVKEAGDRNARLRQPYKTLSAASVVRGYVTPLKGAVEWICRQQDIRSPFADVKSKAPKAARPSEDREPLTLPQLNALMAEAASRARPDEKWLPLLGFLTGARLSELVNLQGRDVRRILEQWSQREITMLEETDRPTSDAWLFNLRQDLVVDGRSVSRAVKTPRAKRLIAAHPILGELGFLDWARQRKGFVFPALHDGVKHPGGAASKRLARLFEKAGIKVSGEGQDVFHCLRHNAKDWLRDCGIPEHTINRHVGHAMTNTGDRYGSKPLRPSEICLLAAAPLPQNLDLSGYRTVTAKR